MNLEVLRVFNELHNLGITKAEYQELQEEQSHKERTGLAIVLVKKGHCICISHDEKHKIVVCDIQHPKIQSKSRILFKTLVTFNDLPDEVYTLHQIAQYRSCDTEAKHTAKKS